MPHYANDRICIRDIAYLYANAVDQRDYPLFESIVTEDAKIYGPEFCFNGTDEIIAGMSAVEQFKRTFHAVHNHIVTIEDDIAEGEIYCVATHIYDKDGIERKLDWGIRYQDKYRRTDAGWRLYERELILDWSQDLPTKGE
ncbi:nuclear transport factor 2 family protein [Oceanicoccus sp. KOV_DT_Chl]|uniref:nuclear transport factor 2 family protein n=1 Tax=Oceanicoccus sp. KOV_DT_Chl TaxID=1904639 RepID=UPI000C7ABE30|nr:nuclear transport factor 2 family protein [Oceanicoccus sp. KOV_DT_Chl]